MLPSFNCTIAHVELHTTLFKVDGRLWLDICVMSLIFRFHCKEWQMVSVSFLDLSNIAFNMHLSCTVVLKQEHYKCKRVWICLDFLLSDPVKSQPVITSVIYANGPVAQCWCHLTWSSFTACLAVFISFNFFLAWMNIKFSNSSVCDGHIVISSIIVLALSLA